MRTERSEFYIRKDFSFIDMGLMGVLDRTLREVYETLRRYVWRSTGLNAELAELYQKGLLVAHVSQGQIAGLVGIQRRQVNTLIAKLRAAKWLKTIESQNPNDNMCIYVLGNVISDEMGGKHEVYWADSCLQVLRDTMMDEVRRRDPERGSLSRSLKIPERIALARAYLAPLGLCAAVSPPLDTGDEGYATECTGGEQSSAQPPGGVEQPTAQGVGDPVHRGVSSGLLTKVEKGEVENEEETNEPSLAAGDGGLDSFDPFESYTNTHVTASKTDLSARVTTEEGGTAPAPRRRRAAAVAAPGAPAPLPVGEDTPAVGAASGELQNPFPTGVRITAASTDTEALIAKRVAETEARRSEQLNEQTKADSRKNNLKGKSLPVEKRGPTQALASLWRNLYAEYYPGVKQHQWGAKEAGMISALLDKYEGDVAVVELGFRYVLKHWPKLSARFKGAGGMPTLGFTVAVHATLFAEAQLVVNAQVAIDAFNAQLAKDKWGPVPSQIRAAYDKAVAVMKQHGLEA